MVSLTRQSPTCIFSSGDFSFSFIFGLRFKSRLRSDNGNGNSNNKSAADLLWPIIIIIIIAVIVIVIGYCVVDDNVVVVGWEGFSQKVSYLSLQYLYSLLASFLSSSFFA